MSKVLDNIKKRAAALGKTIVLPEGEDNRVVKAAAESVKEGIAKIVLPYANITLFTTDTPNILIISEKISPPIALQ